MRIEKKEETFIIKEEVEIGNGVVLEVGDKIKIINEYIQSPSIYSVNLYGEFSSMTKDNIVNLFVVHDGIAKDGIAYPTSIVGTLADDLVDIRLIMDNDSEVELKYNEYDNEKKTVVINGRDYSNNLNNSGWFFDDFKEVFKKYILGK